MKKDEKTPAYEAAFAELQQLLAELQSDTIGIDELAAKIERAKTLIHLCRERLRQTEESLGEFFEKG